MPEMITDNDAHYAYEIVQTICTEVGPGLAGSPQERERAAIIEKESDLCHRIRHHVSGEHHPTDGHDHRQCRYGPHRNAGMSHACLPNSAFHARTGEPLSRLFKALLSVIVRRDPTLLVSMAGTVGMTSVRMFDKSHSGRGTCLTAHSLELVVGSTSWKPAVVDGRIEPREMLCPTVAFDHDIVDGASAARFERRLVELVESGYGLDEDRSLAARDIEPETIRTANVPA